MTARELAAASGVSGATLYSLLIRLIARGELAKRDLPGGQTGYALADGDTPVTAAAGGQAVSADGLAGAPTEDGATAEHRSPADRP